MAYDGRWQVSVGLQCANRLKQFRRTEESERGKMRKLKGNKVLWKMLKLLQKGCKVLHTLCCTRSTALISFTWNILSALSLNIESTGESTGVCLVNLLSNWLTSSSPVCVQEQQQNETPHAHFNAKGSCKQNYKHLFTPPILKLIF